MTKLENQLATEMFGISVIGTVLTDDQVRQVTAAAAVCKGYIDRAVKNLIDRNTTGHQLGEILKKQYQIDYENWLKSEGITE